MNTLKIFSDSISKVVILAGAIGLLAMTLIITWKIFGRYVLGSTPNWSEQAALVLMIWYVSFAAAAGVKEGFHIRILALENACKASVRKLLRMFGHTVVALCGLAMCFWSMQLVIGTWSHAVPTLGIPRGAVYIALPVSGLLIAIFAVEKIFEEQQNKEDVA